MAEPKAVTPAYVPFKTFTSVLDSFKSFLPDSIDTSMWPSYSGGTRSQLLGALRFLGLISESGAPTDTLRKLAVADAQHRPAIFAEVMRGAYGSLMSLDLTKATPGSFDAEMRKFGQEGETHRKAASFFLQAAKWAGVPLSPLLIKKGSLSSSRRRRPPLGAAKSKTAPAGVPLKARVPKAALDYPAVGSSKEIVLSGGARVTLSTDIDLFRMASEDRKFVMQILDQMEAYEAEHGEGLEDAEEEEA